MSAPLPTVEQLFTEAFHRFRTPRSDAYKAGARAGIALKLYTAPITCPYAVGTADADAFYSGINEGSLIAKQALDKAGGVL